ncbi:transcription factor ICE1-like protein, partial [Tanacetum coccineum]
MDQASILVDAIDYLKELRKKVSKLERELDLPPAATPPVTTGFSQLTPTAATIPSCSTKDLVPIREPARVDVQKKGKGVLDIHIFCSPKPDLLYLILKTLNDLG